MPSNADRAGDKKTDLALAAVQLALPNITLEESLQYLHKGYQREPSKLFYSLLLGYRLPRRSRGIYCESHK